jgi:nucleotide-binding universal stress UspA family protein
MNTVIVPIDFSETSLHAARFAADFLAGTQGINIILYHSFSKAAELATVEQNLDELKNELLRDNVLQVETLAHQGDNFVEELNRAVRHKGADLVIMGITGRNAIAQVFIGSNTLKFAETKACPVLIVPEKSQYRPLKNVMLASDFKNALNTTPSVPIKNVLNVVRPNLHIVNVDPEHYIALTDSYEKEKQDLKQMFEEYHPEFYFMRLYDVDDALNFFAEEKNIDMIIVVQQNQNFMQKLFKRSRTRSLSYQSNVPILVVHE